MVVTTTNALRIASNRRHGERLVDLLVDEGPMTGAQACKWLGWSRGRFDSALAFARREICPALELAIPHPTPDDGWRYRVTTEWEPVEAGAAYSLGTVETRLHGINRDVRIIKPHLIRGSKEWRRANFLEKHLSHIVATLTEINNG